MAYQISPPPVQIRWRPHRIAPTRSNANTARRPVRRPARNAAAVVTAEPEHNPLPMPIEIPNLEPQDARSYRAFTASDLPGAIRNLFVPVMALLSLAAAIVVTIADSECDSSDFGGTSNGSGFCCLIPFTRVITVAQFWIHTAVCCWLIQLYRTPLVRLLPRYRGCLIFSFLFRATVLVFIWMLYFLILSLSFISSLQEQIDCGAVSTDNEKALFYTTDVLTWIVCILVLVMLGLMGKKMWRYWELRHLTPEELVAYITLTEQNKAKGLTKDQLAVLTKVTLTCTHGTTTMLACPVCGFQEYQPPSLLSASALINAVSVFPLNLPGRMTPGGPARSTENSVELLNFGGRNGNNRNGNGHGNGHSVENGRSGRRSSEAEREAAAAAIARLTDETLANAPPSFIGPPLIRRGSSTGSSSDKPEVSKATLVPLGGQASMTCAICLEDYLIHSRVVILPCHHHGHISCLSGWFEGHSTCPMCRAKVVREHRR